MRRASSSPGRRALLVGLVALPLGCSDRSPGATGSDGLRREVEDRVEAAGAAGFSGSVLVTVDGATLLARSYGLADREGDIANQVDTAYDVGSVMKDLTAAAVFQLASDGMLAVTDPIATFFEEAPADKAAITILQVIQHRAGFREYHDTEGDFEPMTRLEARQRILAQELLFEPGTDQAYSNAGYTLLADVIETVSGRSFTDLVREEILAPAGMERSGFYGDPVWDEVETAIGYDASRFQDNDPATWPYTWALVGNGGLVTTVLDLDRWFVAIRAGDVLPPAALEAYEVEYLGEGSADAARAPRAAAGGSDFGFGGYAMDSPDEGTRVILGTNRYDALDVDGFGDELSLLVLGLEDQVSRSE